VAPQGRRENFDCSQSISDNREVLSPTACGRSPLPEGAKELHYALYYIRKCSHMDMLEFLRTRRTYRRFEQRPVAPEILTEAVDAARIASCGANRQTVRYIVVQSADAVAAVQPLVHWAAYLPPEQGQPKPDELPTAFIAVLQDDNLPGASDVDVGLALGSLTAAAWAHGVGSCIMGAIDRPALTELLALPDGVRLCYMVALGYPTHASKLVEMQDGSVKYYLDENRGYCVPKRSMDEVLLKTL
jgi:FMN reductase [NAD(P)H]